MATHLESSSARHSCPQLGRGRRRSRLAAQKLIDALDTTYTRIGENALLKLAEPVIIDAGTARNFIERSLIGAQQSKRFSKQVVFHE